MILASQRESIGHSNNCNWSCEAPGGFCLESHRRIASHSHSSLPWFYPASYQRILWGCCIFDVQACVIGMLSKL